MMKTTKKSGNGKVLQYSKDVVDHLAAIDKLEDASVVLLGSAARACLTPRSDIDLLVVSDEEIPRWRTPMDLHLQIQTREEFLERLREKNDFHIWALRNGKAVWDQSEWFRRVKQRPEASAWPNWEEKLSFARKRLETAKHMLAIGDEEAGAEELRYATSHVARATLLKAHVFPLSRPELPDQLRQIGKRGLADALDALIYTDVELSRAKWIAQLVEEEFTELSALWKSQS